MANTLTKKTNTLIKKNNKTKLLTCTKAGAERQKEE